MLFPILGPKLWWPRLTKGKQTEQVLCWSGMTDAEHTTSASNEEEASHQFTVILFFQPKQPILKFFSLQKQKGLHTAILI